MHLLVESGQSVSLAGHIKARYAWIDIQHCLDHALDLINKKAFALVPKRIQSFIKAIPSRVRTPKAKEFLRGVFDSITLADWIAEHKVQGNDDIAEAIEKGDFLAIPSYCETRWYGNLVLIGRILQHQPTLIRFFSSKEYKNKEMMELLSDLFNRVYLQFLYV
jgi:hypothetical protein